jgi:hypothetical protein
MVTKTTDKKVSSNQVDQSPSMFGFVGDAKSLAIDPASIRLVAATKGPIVGALSSGSTTFSTGFIVGASEETNVDESIAALLPKLEDISIKSMVLDYSTNPVSVKLILKIKNSTGYPVKGISGRIPKK